MTRWAVLVALLAAASADTDVPQEVEDPAAALSGMYSDCLARLSLPCAQRKVLVFLDWLGRAETLDVLGGAVTLVRTSRDTSPPLTEARLAGQEDLEPLIDHSVDRFFSSHALRLRLPQWLEAALGGEPASTIDLSVGRALDEEGRGKKKKKKKKLKLLKKILLVLGLVKLIKIALLAPLALILIKLKAVKALLIGGVAIIIAKVLLFKKLFMSLNKGGGGGGGGGGEEKHVIVVHSEGGGGGGGSLDTGYGVPSAGGGHGGGGGGTVSDSYGPPTGGGGGGGGGSSWSSSGGGGGWGRSLGAEDSHWLAYRAYVPVS